MLPGIALLTGLWAGLAAAHPSHSSYAEVEWGAEGTLDVALRIVPEDLERALGLAAGRRVPLVDSPELRELLSAYLEAHFQLPGQPAQDSLVLLGMQLGYRETWIYFSLPAPRRDDLALRNTVLMDLERSQSNRVKRLWAPGAPVLLFTVEEPVRSLAVSTE